MSGKAKILIARQFVGEAITRIKEQYDVVEWQEEGAMPVELLKRWIADCDGYFGVSDPLRGEVLEAAKKLRTISHVAAGTDNIDIAACTARGISVGNTPGALVDATADMTIALLLTFTRRMVEQTELVRSGRWVRNTPTQLLGMDIKGKTLGIVGMGQIGMEAARRATAFGMKIVYCNRKPRTDLPPGFAVHMPLDALLRLADIVSIHAPLTDETKGMFDRERFRLMKRSALLINMARGPLVDTDALCEALEERRIAGAALDVTDPEPLPAGHRLLRTQGVIVTPHAGSATWETRNAMALTALENLQLGLAGKPLKHCVNPEVYAGAGGNRP